MGVNPQVQLKEERTAGSACPVPNPGQARYDREMWASSTIYALLEPELGSLQGKYCSCVTTTENDKCDTSRSRNCPTLII